MNCTFENSHMASIGLAPLGFLEVEVGSTKHEREFQVLFFIVFTHNVYILKVNLHQPMNLAPRLFIVMDERKL